MVMIILSFFLNQQVNGINLLFQLKFIYLQIILYDFKQVKQILDILILLVQMIYVLIIF